MSSERPSNIAGEAESLGAFEETALTEADAWDANADLDPEGGHGN